MPTKLWLHTCWAISPICWLLGCSPAPAPVRQEPVSAEAPVTTDQLISELIEKETDSGSPKAPSILPQPGQDKVIPQRYKDAPVQRVVRKYDSGKPRVVFEAKMLGERSVVQHGDYVEYYLNAQKQKQGRYEYGNKVGEWTYWSKTGQIRKKGNYEKDKQQGVWKKFRDDGSLEWIEKYVDGLANGEWEAYREDGKTVFWQRNYKRGERHGKWQNFHPNGKPHTLEEYAAGKLDGPAMSWDESGNKIGEGTFRQGKRHGLFRRYKDGKLHEEANWVDDVRQGSGQ